MRSEAIYSGEATRHLINYTREEDYYLNMNHLKDALITRGYPIHMLKDVPYDEAKRASLLKRLAERRRSRDQRLTHRYGRMVSLRSK